MVTGPNWWTDQETDIAMQLHGKNNIATFIVIEVKLIILS